MKARFDSHGNIELMAEDVQEARLLSNWDEGKMNEKFLVTAHISADDVGLPTDHCGGVILKPMGLRA